MSIVLNRDNLKGFVHEKELIDLVPKIKKAHSDLHNKKGKGSDYVGWIDLPTRVSDDFLRDLKVFALEIQKSSDAIISIGIGGSYLGIRSTIECFGKSAIPIYYAGHNISADYLYDLLEDLKDKRVTIVVISKSGTTTEPAIAFRVIKRWMEKKYQPEELKKRIVCVTDEKKGALRQIVNVAGYHSYVIPDDVGGRFSVLTPVGLVPLALAGIDVQSLIEGARRGEKEYSDVDLNKNTAYLYAACRYLLYKKRKKIEVLSTFYPNMGSIAEWWKQLFGESEGKDGKGIFPASLVLSTDLHSMGQLMQDGERNIFETFLMLDKAKHQILIPKEEGDVDGFNCIAGKDIDFVNKQAYRATAEAHFEGGIPNMTITLCQADAFHVGQLYYLFEKAVGISGYLLKVNPFDQPGVEAYKTKMFKLLGKS